MPFLTDRVERDLIAQIRSCENRNEALDRLIAACRYDLDWAKPKWLSMLRGSYLQPDAWLQSIIARGVSQACLGFDLNSGNRFSGYALRVIGSIIWKELSLFGSNTGSISKSCPFQSQLSSELHHLDEYTCRDECDWQDDLLKMRPCKRRLVWKAIDYDNEYRELYSSTPRYLKEPPHQDRVSDSSHYHPESPIDKVFCDNGVDKPTIVLDFHESFDGITDDKADENAHHTSRLDYRHLSREGRINPIEDALMPDADQLPEDATEIDTSCLPAPMADVFSDLVEGSDDSGVFNFQAVADWYSLSIREVKDIYLDCVSRLKRHNQVV